MTSEPMTETGSAAVPNGAGGGGSPPRMPRWVKVFGIIVAVLALLSVLRFTGLGGMHGGGHVPGPGTPPASGTPAHHAPGGGH
jgi:hypothetical protein